MGGDARQLALTRARGVLPGYARWLDERDWRVEDGWPPPVSAKSDMFGEGLGAWLADGPLVDAAEVITSSGLGGTFSLGLVPSVDAERLSSEVESTMVALGAREGERGMLVNCLPQGVAVPPGSALLANCGINVEAALAVLRDIAPSQGPVILVGEPLLLKELIERGAADGPEWAPARMLVITGGEWVAEGLRAHMERLLPAGSAGVLISCGAAELGLHAFVEDPALRGLRGLLAADPGARAELMGSDPGVAPTLLAYDPTRLSVERVGREPRMAVTTLDERPLPLVRYDLGDRAAPVDVAALVRLARRHGLEEPSAPAVIAHLGRCGPAGAPGPSVEQVKEALFRDSERARALTGRFRLESGPDGPTLVLERQERPGSDASPLSLRELEEALGITGIRVLGSDYPHHRGGHARKTRYVQVGSA